MQLSSLQTAHSKRGIGGEVRAVAVTVELRYFPQGGNDFQLHYVNPPLAIVHEMHFDIWFLNPSLIHHTCRRASAETIHVSISQFLRTTNSLLHPTMSLDDI